MSRRVCRLNEIFCPKKQTRLICVSDAARKWKWNWRLKKGLSSSSSSLKNKSRFLIKILVAGIKWFCQLWNEGNWNLKRERKKWGLTFFCKRLFFGFFAHLCLLQWVLSDAEGLNMFLFLRVCIDGCNRRSRKSKS